METVGEPYTWAKGSVDPIHKASKLDRTFIGHLAQSFTFTRIGKSQWPFKLYNLWLQQVHHKKIVEKQWGMTTIDTSLYKFTWRLKMMKNETKMWNATLGTMAKQIEKAREALIICCNKPHKYAHRPDTPSSNELCNALQELLVQDEQDHKKWSKANWPAHLKQ